MEKEIKGLKTDPERVGETLRVNWKMQGDKFVFTKNMKVYILTKRETISAVSSVFDPLGFLVLFTLKANLLIQLMWRRNLEWDDEVLQNIAKA